MTETLISKLLVTMVLHIVGMPILKMLVKEDFTSDGDADFEVAW